LLDRDFHLLMRPVYQNGTWRSLSSTQSSPTTPRSRQHVPTFAPVSNRVILPVNRICFEVDLKTGGK
jgi:hypothetical protein